MREMSSQGQRIFSLPPVEACAGMMPQQYCLRWKYHNSNFQSTFAQLQEKDCFCDVTLWCGGVATRAHRAVLASCSALLAALLATHEGGTGEPALVLDRTEPRHLRHLLSFMYTGEVSVHHTELAGLLKTAEELRIKGLADVSWNTPPKPPATKTEPARPVPTDPLLLPKVCVSPVHNGSVPVLASLPSPATVEPVKRKRGRPPLEPRNNILPECEVPPLEPSPKRPKVVPQLLPSVPKKSKQEVPEESVFKDAPGDWKGFTPQATSEQEAPEELSSEYSESSLDGRDISQFLDTTMEEEQAEAAAQAAPSSEPVKVEVPPQPVEPAPAPEVSTQFADVVKLSDYLVRGRRPQFWAEDYVKRVMEAVFCKELEMKQAAEMLGVSYGTLYGRYRDCFGCINRPYRIRDFWTEQGPAEVLMKLQRKELTVFKAAEMLNVTPQTLTNYLANLPDPASADASSANRSNDDNSPEESANQANPIYDDDSDGCDTESDDVSEFAIPADIEAKLEKSMLKKPNIKTYSAGESLLKKMISEPAIGGSTVDDEEFICKDSEVVKDKMPSIRVANLKFLKGESPGSAAGESVLSDSTNASSLLKATHPDITILSTRRKVTFQEIAMTMTKRQVKDQGSPESIS